ncbi:hypothetical protein M2650_01475 [Luteimonas sp. SX5]|uniref:Uncharacterized protein n=1 Tax=Luteimonas galliterrae TaxID=2940486 RepID=A0ABT0MEM0_9GAMM|nr:hypothetical protein [Luteimonas galliterrae]MCL1633318.1 hypothetical protein [Luteimonas galliterrae]
MMGKVTVLSLLLAAFAASAAERGGGPAYPLLDGECGEYPALAQSKHPVADDVVLYVFQDRDYVWLCYTLPANSFGMADLTVAAPALKKPLNLHVSAQLGEWPADEPNAAPAGPDSPRWWNHRGWSGTTVPFNGAKATLDETGKPEVDYNFRMTRARELQLSKQRFGRGQWRWHIDIRNVADEKGGQMSLRFPKEGEQTLRAE